MVSKSLFLKRIIRQYRMELCKKDALKMSNCCAEVVVARTVKIYLHDEDMSMATIASRDDCRY